MACRGLHKDVVDPLLEYGANPNSSKVLPQQDTKSLPLHQAATASSLSITRKLLAKGAQPNLHSVAPDTGLTALWWAYARENTQVIKLLENNGALFSNRTTMGRSLAAILHYLRYDSMAEMLSKTPDGYPLLGPPCTKCEREVILR